MAEVNKEIYSQLSLTTYTITGSLNKSDIEAVVKDFYAHEPTQFVLWDVTGCSQLELSAIDLENISKFILNTKIDRPKGKTAFVINENDLGMGILFENLARMEHLPYEYRSFNSQDEAMYWLGLKI